MIVTRKWLEEWIDLSQIATEDIVKTLNKIGLEVAKYQKFDIPKDVVVGKVVSCQKHPDADKLSVCEVDIGDDAPLQIVCGAKNAKYANYVAVAKVGAHLSKDFVIKPAKLRGVESYGMLCGSTEIGLPKIEDGIMLLDESIGELELGKELREYDLFNDELIEIELTANRGDCQSVLGIARELGVAYGRSLREHVAEEDSSVKIGIGRMLNFDVAKDVESSLIYKAFSCEEFSNPFLIRFRVALSEESFSNRAEEFGYYITYSTGVIVRVYGFEAFASKEPAIVVKKDEKRYDAVYGTEKASIIGVYQFDSSKPSPQEKQFIVEASFVEPESISKKMFETPIKSDWVYYRSSRGSDPRIRMGIEYLKYLLLTYYPDAKLYSGTHENVKEYEKEAIKIPFDELDQLIGKRIDRNEMVEILKALEFTIMQVNDEAMIVKTPIFRHDIKNLQDVAEEIVRIYGIDKIEAKPLCFQEKNRLNDAYETYKKRRFYKDLSLSRGYFETVSYIFTNSALLQKYGLPRVKKDLDLLNPITKEMDTLRTSLVPNLLQQAVENVKNGQKRVKLFEIGTIFDEQREEKLSFTLLFSGFKEPESVLNQGKPSFVSFADMAEDLSCILGDIQLRQLSKKAILFHPYQAATIIKGEKEIGELYKLHITIQEELDLPPTYIAEIAFDELPFGLGHAKPYSIYQLSLKDLSILVDKEIPFATIKEILQKSVPKEIKRFYPVAVYEDEKLGEKKSLTIRFAVQSDEKTLTEEEIASILENILKLLQEKVGAVLR